jgi:hypothetical protein
MNELFVGLLDPKAIKRLREWYDILHAQVPSELQTIDKAIYERLLELRVE